MRTSTEVSEYMPCHHPLQAFYSERSDGKKDLMFSAALARGFAAGMKMPDGTFSLPCGRCMGCRLERSRQWAVRIMHEAMLYEDNCFVTLTFSDEKMKEMCPNGSLVKKHMQDFMKRLRKRFPERKIRYFLCGEYGEKLGRPHYHLCIFNFDFVDKKFWKSVNDLRYYISDLLSELWPCGHSTIGALNFDSAAYVARYCTKKITGSAADDHYQGKLPEFCQMSLKPGLAHGWLEKFGSDVFSYDVCVSRGVKTKPPRYYDKFLERVDPGAFAKTRAARVLKATAFEDDNTYRRLLVKEKCLEAKFKLLVRKMEKV